MTDIVDQATRSRMMSGIRGKNTGLEWLVRRALHSRGLRYRLHDRNLPGHPDLVFPKYRAAIFINGCFWHGHDCHLFKAPRTRPAFWLEKIEGTRQRDKASRKALEDRGWRVLTLWECALRGKSAREQLTRTVDSIVTWLDIGAARTVELSSLTGSVLPTSDQVNEFPNV